MSDQQHEKHKHHILSLKTALVVWIALLVGTVITVVVAQFNLGALNFPVAMLIATVKALLVVLYFMGLKYDSNDNRLIFGTSFIFFGIFVVLTLTDLLFRGDVVAKGKFFSEVKSDTKVAKPWVSTPDLLAMGKETFGVQCVSCHGALGKGDGPAAVALNPRPRNFSETAGWSNGRKPSQIFKTLDKGLRAMPSFASIPAVDRWALSHYVASLGPSVEKDSESDLRAIGVDPSKEMAGEVESKSIPIDLAIELQATDGQISR